MKPALLTLLAAGLLAGSLLALQDGDPAHHEESPLEEHMLTIEEHLGGLRRTLRDPERTQEALDHLVAIQRATFEARFETPPMAADVPEGEERAAFVRDYRKTLVQALAIELELETALLDGDIEGAKAAFLELHDLEEDGHERFTHDE